MKAKRFTAKNMQQALRMVSAELGPDAVILSNKRLGKGVEVIAALDYQEMADEQQQQEIDRQLSLQQELEQAKQATGKIRQAQPSQAQASQEKPKLDHANVSSTAALKEALMGIKEGTIAQSKALDAVMQSEEELQQTMSQKTSSMSSAEAEPFLAKVSDELKDLKNWLVSQQGNAWNPNRPLSWQQAQIWQRCQDLGIDPSWADKLVSAIPDDDDENIEKGWAQCLRFIAEDLPLAENNMLHTGGCFAFVGPTGAGKSTTIGKLAAQYVMNHGSDNIALITMDNYRIAAHDQLKTFARIMEVPLMVLEPNGDLSALLEKLSDKKFILIDTAGLAIQDPHFSVQLSMLKGAGNKVHTLLALPLTSQARCLQENFEHFKPAGIDGCIFTKLDECFSLGQAMSIASVTRLPIHMVTDGPHIPDDIHFPNAEKMVRLAEQMARMAQTRWQTSEMSSAANNNFMQHGV
ncbi:MAG: flagellar biosynthesis protein FlhF [Oleispira sp.]|nr:flagellar biosynthesis protein FlhF [Oleispira sp.]